MQLYKASGQALGLSATSSSIQAEGKPAKRQKGNLNSLLSPSLSKQSN